VKAARQGLWLPGGFFQYGRSFLTTSKGDSLLGAISLFVDSNWKGKTVRKVFSSVQYRDRLCQFQTLL
jgi:hypothetical protein